MRMPTRLALAAALLALCGAPAARPQATNIPTAVARTMTVNPTTGVVTAPKGLVVWQTQTNVFARATITNLTAITSATTGNATIGGSLNVTGTITGVLATNVPIADAGTLFVATNVETALAELATGLAAVDNSAYVLKAGDTMTGNLTVSASNATLIVRGTGTPEIHTRAVVSAFESGALGIIDFSATSNVTSRSYAGLSAIIGGDGNSGQYNGNLNLWAANPAGGQWLGLTVQGGTSNVLLAVDGTVQAGDLTAASFSGPGAGLTGVDASTLGGASGSAFLLKAGGTMSGTINMGGHSITNASRFGFSTGTALGNDGMENLIYVSSTGNTNLVISSATGLLDPGSQMEQDGATAGQVLTWSGAAWAPATVSAGIGGGTGGTDNLALRADGAGGATLQSSDLVIGDASTSTANNLLLSNNHSGQTNSSLGLAPKGTGAFFLGAAPDATSTGGNARGNYAVDLQRVRNTAARVASGANSAIPGGERNTASGIYSFAMGYQSTASGNFASVAMGYGASATTDFAIALGNSPTASHSGSFVVGLDSASGPSSDRAEQFKVKGDGGFTLQNATGTLTHWGKWTSAPVTGIGAGDMYYDTGTNKLRVYDGSAWNDLW